MDPLSFFHQLVEMIWVCVEVVRFIHHTKGPFFPFLVLIFLGSPLMLLWLALGTLLNRHLQVLKTLPG